MQLQLTVLLACVSAVIAQGDPQKSKTLLDSVIQKIDQGGAADPGQVDSDISQNNFINFCDGKGLQLTNGKQVKEGSCNPTPMGIILGTDRMPACKFVDPPNLGVVKANENFTISLKIENFSTGFFTNPAATYFAAPQDTNNDRFMKGHSHVTCNPLDSITTTGVNPADKFSFFKGLNGKADGNGILSTVVAGGLPEGDYRCCSINSAANHQPALVAVAQHASLDDCIYITATSNGQDPEDDNNNSGNNGNNGAAQQNNSNGNGNSSNGNGNSSNGNSNSNGNSKGQQQQSSNGNGNKGESKKGENKSNDKSSKKSEQQQEAARCRTKRLRRRAAHQKRAAELERMRRQRRAA